jgi:hypothetical protein
MNFVWAALGVVVFILAVQFGKEAFDCQQVGGKLVQTVIPLEYVCVSN